jgi:hypothetical protein
MTFKRALWLPIAIGVVVINLAGGVYAYLTSEPMHAFVHGAIAVGFALWARHLYHGSEQRERQLERQDRVQLLEANLSELERELSETQERLDFADQLLKKKPPSS